MSNKIKSETIYRIDHVPGEEIDLDQDFDSKQSYHEYDETGNLLFEIAFTKDGEISDKVEYKYDAQGILVETLVYGEFNDVLERKELVWGGDNRVTREIIHYLDGSEDIHEFFYDEQGNPTGMVVKDDEDELELSEKYFYEGGKVVRVERWNEDDELIFSQEDEFEEGKLKTRTIWSAEEQEPYTIVQHFNAAGHRNEELRFNSSKQIIERNTYEEDENGRVVRMVEENKQKKNTTEFSYDDKGNVIYQKETDLNGYLNHEVFRTYNPDGELIKTTVEVVISRNMDLLQRYVEPVLSPTYQKQAYSLIYQRERFRD